MVTVGYGEITPLTTAERIVCILNMILSVGMYAYTINVIGQIVSKYNVTAIKYEERMKYVNKFMRQKNIPTDLRTKIIRYLEYNWELKKQVKIEDKDVFSLLGDNLRDEILLQINGIILNSIRAFEQFSYDFLAKISFIIKRRNFVVDDIVFNVRYIVLVHEYRKMTRARICFTSHRAV